MNKNTKRAKKRGLTNHDETTIGTGAGRQIIKKDTQPIFKGSACDTARRGKNRWMGAAKAHKGNFS